MLRTPPPADALAPFHPLVRDWFLETLGEPTAPQVQGWPLIRAGKDVLISAPTGSGKTLTAFLACLDELFRLGAEGRLPDETRVLYVSPLKALGNDVQKNLLEPLAQLRARALASGVTLPEVRVLVRSGDTTASERAAMVKRPPHVLITTPESLYLYLTAQKSRATLQHVRTVVVDELHSLARDKRGSHFALSMERLRALLPVPPQCIGLSATIRPLELLARFLVGAERPCEVVQVGHLRRWELTLEVPEEELTAVATHEMWAQFYDRLAVLSQAHRTMLVFANTRRLAERIAHDLGERLGQGLVAAHHGSMAREARVAVEERLKGGQLKVLVATASLELGLDIGSIDLVVQVGTPRSIAVMLQRLGRSGHHKAAVSKGLVWVMSRDELVECTALLRAVHEGELDAVRLPSQPLDVLAQQVVAEVAAQDWDERALYHAFRQALPYASLTWEAFEQVLQLVCEGVATSRGRSRVQLHRDRVHGQLKPRRGARLTALQNGGTIPDLFSYPVIAEPEDQQVGTVDEDFAIESMPGEVFLLGSTAWRIRRIFGGQVRVESAQGQPPTVPFWNGEAPARTDELSREVGRLREDVLARGDAREWLTGTLGLPPHAADLLVRYLEAGQAALGAVPSQTCVVAERFFDEAGGMQLIVHAPFGARINRAWGLALRKSFCRAFDFELQAAANDDGILLSLGEQHSFPLEDVFDFVPPAAAERVLTQAVLQAPLFATRFRWAAGRALVLSRLRNGQRVPPPLQRARAEDLIAAVFPEQVGCQDNHGGMELEPPDHPLVAETMKDCLREAMDVDGLVQVLTALKAGQIRRVARDVPEPSVFAHALLSSAPYTFLDDAPLEERRARAVSVRRSLPPKEAVAFGALDQAAIDQVVADAAPLVRDEEELHDALLQLGVWPTDARVFAAEAGLEDALPRWLSALRGAGRVGVAQRSGGGSAHLGDSAASGSGTAQLGGSARSGSGSAQLEDSALSGSASAHLGDSAPSGSEMAQLGGSAPPGGGLVGAGGARREFAFAVERQPLVRALFPTTALPLDALPGDGPVEEDAAARQVVRGWMEVCGPITAAALAERLGLSQARVDDALARLEAQGQVLRGTFSPGAAGGAVEWCDRRLLQRIHRLTVGRLRKEIEPLSAQDFMRFLFRWHHIGVDTPLRGPGGLARVVSLLEGFEAPAAAWEKDLFPARLRRYVGEWLEHACFSGEVAWGRLTLREPKAVPSVRRGAAVAAAARQRGAAFALAAARSTEGTTPDGAPDLAAAAAPPRSGTAATTPDGAPDGSGPAAEHQRFRSSRAKSRDPAVRPSTSLGVTGRGSAEGENYTPPDLAAAAAPTPDGARDLAAAAAPPWGGAAGAHGRLREQDATAPSPWRSTATMPREEALGKGRRTLEPAPPLERPRPVVPGRNASLTFTRRADLEWLLAAARPGEVLADGPRPLPDDLTAAARDVVAALERRGASFFAELQASTRRLPTEVEDALWELLARGFVTADAVQNLRVLQSPKTRRRQRALQRGGPGRWSLLRPAEPQDGEAVVEKVAQLLLQRYGIVTRDVVVREALCPPWRELLRVYRRLEARGELRGGRFLSGVAGEQFALPEAVELARATRRAPKTGQVVRLSAVDPLNLTGVVTPGPRVPSVMGQVVTWVDGVPQGGEATDAARPALRPSSPS